MSLWTVHFHPDLLAHFQVKKTMEKIRIIIAEMLGTMILVTIGCGSIVQMLTLKTSFLNVNLSFGLGAMIGILISAPISGGHINPAVTGIFNPVFIQDLLVDINSCVIF